MGGSPVFQAVCGSYREIVETDDGIHKALVEGFVRHHPDDHEGTQQRKEVVGVEIDLELTVLLACREVAHAHDLGIESVMGNGIEHQFFGLELRVGVFPVAVVSVVDDGNVGSFSFFVFDSPLTYSS